MYESKRIIVNKQSIELLRRRMAVNKRSLTKIWKLNNRSNGFTNSFMGQMFEDTTMDKERTKKIVEERMRIKKEITDSKKLQLVHEEMKKKMILSLYKERFQIGMKKGEEMPIEKLENVLSYKATKKQQKKAVIKIQAAVRGFLEKKKYREKVKRRNDASRYIQRIWRRYRMISMVPKAWRKFKHDRITRIQKYIQGYLVYKRVYHELNESKLKSNFDYFNKIKNYLMNSAQIKIRYYWFKYKKMKMKKEEAKKNKGKGKGGKRGSLVKKGSVTYKTSSSSTAKKSSETVSKPSDQNVKPTVDPSAKPLESVQKSSEINQKSKTDISSVKTEVASQKSELKEDISNKIDSKTNIGALLPNAENLAMNSTMPIPHEIPLLPIPSDAPSQVSVPIIEEEENEEY